MVDVTQEDGIAIHRDPVPWWAVVLVVAATFGAGMAMLVPMTYTLAVRLDQLAPGQVGALGVVLGIGSATTLVVAPLSGILSDRTRTRFGRRRPFTVAGLALGLLSVGIMIAAPNVGVLTLGWVVAAAGWGTATGSIGNWQADRLPVKQRGSVSGATGLAMQVSPVVGMLVVAPLSGRTDLAFLVPAGVALVLVGLFVIFAPEQDTRGMALEEERLTVRMVLRSFLFSPRAAPDFAWAWLGRFVFFLGLTATTSFTVYFIAQRLDLAVADVVGVMALVSALSMITATFGSLGGGWLSDRLARRRPFVFLGSLLFGAGSLVLAFAGDFTSILTGMLISSLGIALFSTAGQALVLDVLPDRDSQAGRYMAITLFAQKIPGVLAPLLAPLLLLVGGGDENFTVLYGVSALLAVAGGAVIATRVTGVR
ncbi:MFS family permease [Pseudoclavibacter sp. JAI123]|uniref:MFS transporter n=1 Tax=Pseudoclavibacter sp. JAI123 TaxID=2723065 RepID=UPI0015C859DE|nr:MFS transporter [Pseudoclavibacter sp. JAI123]NYF12258.1 MFS family permease [Pseudoclavibacter sp. JAI123]